MRKNLIIIHGTAYMVREKHFIEASKLSNQHETRMSDEQHDEYIKRLIEFSNLIESLYVPMTNDIPCLMW